MGLSATAFFALKFNADISWSSSLSAELWFDTCQIFIAYDKLSALPTVTLPWHVVKVRSVSFARMTVLALLFLLVNFWSYYTPSEYRPTLLSIVHCHLKLHVCHLLSNYFHIHHSCLFPRLITVHQRLNLNQRVYNNV